MYDIVRLKYMIE